MVYEQLIEYEVEILNYITTFPFCLVILSLTRTHKEHILFFLSQF